MGFVRGIAVIPTVRALRPLSDYLLSKLCNVALVVLLLLNVTGFWLSQINQLFVVGCCEVCRR